MEVWNEILRIIFDQISKRDMSVYKDFIKYGAGMSKPWRTCAIGDAFENLWARCL